MATPESIQLSTAPIPIEKIRPSKTNPRRVFDKAGLEELAGSIRAHGILQPLLLRPVPEASEVNGHRYELVAGERRFRAAQLAGLDSVPALVRELGDKEVLEIQVVENLQRSDLHPLEEAEGYRQLHEKHGYAIEDLAAKVGKSKGYVYARLKLGALPEKAKKLFLEGKLSPSTALLVARIPDAKLAEKAAVAICRPDYEDREMSFRDASHYIQHEFMLRLGEAPWSLADAQLLPEAGACTVCPKRSGNQPELFEDVKNADVCTDQACFGRKRQAHSDRALAEASAAGREVLKGKEAKNLFESWDSTRLKDSAPFIEMMGRCDADPKWKPGSTTPRSWKKVLGEHAPAPVIAVDDRGGVHELLPRKAAVEALKAAGVKPDRFLHSEISGSSRRADDAAEARRRQDARVRAETVRRVLGELVPKIEKQDLGAAAWRLLLKHLIKSSWHDVVSDVTKRRGLEIKGKRGESQLEKHLEGFGLRQLHALLFELVATRGASAQWQMGYGDAIKRLSAHFKVDIGAAEKKVRGEIKTKEKKTTKS